MTASAYLAWFVGMAVFTFLLLAISSVAASGYWERAARERRRAERSARATRPDARGRSAAGATATPDTPAAERESVAHAS